MRSVVLRGPEPMTVEEISLDGPEAGEVLIKTIACSVCHSDLHTINRAKSGPLPVPVILGHEAAASSRRSVPTSRPSRRATTSSSRSVPTAASATSARAA